MKRNIPISNTDGLNLSQAIKEPLRPRSEAGLQIHDKIKGSVGDA
jgi:hypothetical protein